MNFLLDIVGTDGISEGGVGPCQVVGDWINNNTEEFFTLLFVGIIIGFTLCKLTNFIVKSIKDKDKKDKSGE